MSVTTDDLTAAEKRAVRFLAYVPARTTEALSNATGLTPDAIESLWKRGFVVRRVRDGVDIHFASLTGVQAAMAGSSVLPESLQWQFEDRNDD